MVSRRDSARAFSLVEVVVVVAIVSVITAMSVPNMMNAVRRAFLAGVADDVASFLARAQAEAMATRRCVKVYVAGGTLKADRLNSFDCDSLSSTLAPVLIDSSTGMSQWINFATMKRESTMVTIAMSTVPSETTSTATSEQDQIRFRPSGRLFSSDTDLTDDDGVILVSANDNDSTSGTQTKRIVVEAQGLICVLPLNARPSGTGNNLSCP